MLKRHKSFSKLTGTMTRAFEIFSTWSIYYTASAVVRKGSRLDEVQVEVDFFAATIEL